MWWNEELKEWLIFYDMCLNVGGDIILVIKGVVLRIELWKYFNSFIELLVI